LLVGGQVVVELTLLEDGILEEEEEAEGYSLDLKL
jgi:hypothetical protein